VLSLFAYPVVLAAVYAFWVIRRLAGFSRWERMSQLSQVGLHINAQLRTKGHPMLMLLPV
jgi:hypothetical protein